MPLQPILSNLLVFCQRNTINKKGNWELKEYKNAFESLNIKSIGVFLLLLADICEDTGLSALKRWIRPILPAGRLAITLFSSVY